ncbi:hypothetical protein CHARACLAT_017570 [Characodon lateralis]|uniref:Uncharacterized protein n=1 Tax=Characodon lateralis TaxID=208331 RepID=A0ABU7F542_9TELE|nr:hypothetical protein [Characodon lateralis]
MSSRQIQTAERVLFQRQNGKGCAMPSTHSPIAWFTSPLISLLTPSEYYKRSPKDPAYVKLILLWLLFCCIGLLLVSLFFIRCTFTCPVMHSFSAKNKVPLLQDCPTKLSSTSAAVWWIQQECPRDASIELCSMKLKLAVETTSSGFYYFSTSSWSLDLCPHPTFNSFSPTDIAAHSAAERNNRMIAGEDAMPRCLVLYAAERLLKVPLTRRNTLCKSLPGAGTPTPAQCPVRMTAAGISVKTDRYQHL